MKAARWFTAVCVATCTLATVEAAAVPQCGNQKDDCQCGANNPYPCCSNGSNCTWWAWKAACCNWKVGLPGWGNANTWASYASKNGNYQVLGDPVPGSIATSTKGQYGHVAWVESVNGNKINVTEMNCCGTCNYGMRKWTYDKSYFNSGFIIKKGLPPPGPVCPNNKCEGAENCANCPNDCGSCCGNGKCDNGESCGSCAKDCGSCCGNGACDNGESCGSCAKDCVCLPQGQLDQATCSAVAGWAKDPDTPKPVPVSLREGDTVLASGIADLAHPKHPGHGFWWATPKTLKDGKPHAVKVQAQDNSHPKVATLGPSSFLCATGVVPSAGWQSQQVEHSGVAVLIPEAEGWTVRHHHWADNPYPLAGKVSSCLTPLLGPFDEGYASIAYSFGAHPFATEVALDDALLGQFVATGDERIEFGKGTTLCLHTTALKEIAVPVEASAELGPVHVRRGPWWFTATPAATGWLPALRQNDGVDVRAQGTLAGAVRAEHNFLEPFDQVEWTSQPEDLPDGVHLRLRVGVAEIAADKPGKQVANGLWGQEVAIEVRADAPTVAPEKFRAQVFDLRVRRTGVDTNGPWRVEHVGSYGLVADVTPSAAEDTGMQLTMWHHPPAWWTTGQVRAATSVTLAPIERVSATVALDAKLLAANGLTAELEVGRKVVWSSQNVPATHTGPLGLDVTLDELPKGPEIAWTFRIAEDRWQTVGTAVAIRSARWRAAGWWTYPSANLKGWVDLRPTGGARIEARQLVVGGTLLVERGLPWEAKAVKLNYRQNLRPIEAKARLLFDRKVMREFSEVGGAYQQFELAGPVQRIAIEVQTQADEVGLADVATADAGKALRWAEITGVRVLTPDGKWLDIDEAAPASTGVDAKGDSSAAKSSTPAAADPPGCATAKSSSSPLWLWPAALAACAILLARRRSRADP